MRLALRTMKAGHYGKLTDGTLVMGPFKEKPSHAPSVHVHMRGVDYFVTYCCNEVSEAQVQEIREWAFTQVAARL
jgi:hypothetical protein